MSNRELWIPLSVRNKIANAIVKADPADYGNTTLEWARAEAACEAITPFILELINSPECAITKPANNRDSLEDRRAEERATKGGDLA